MSETETTVTMDDKSLFDAAIGNEAEAPAQEAEVAQETVQTTQEAEGEPEGGPARDEHGRFVAKERPEAALQPKEQPEARQADAIPPWRLKEEADARRAADARAAELERRLYELSGQLKQFTEKPAEQIDPFADPEKFTNHLARQAVDPVRSEVESIREYYSRKDAIRAHGEETVSEAYKWLDQAARARNPDAVALVQRVKTSIDPFEEIVTAYKRDKALSTVGNDPNAWFEKELERRLADPEFKQKLGVAPSQAQSPTNIVKLPPSLNRAPGTSGNSQPGSIDDKSLYAFATG